MIKRTIGITCAVGLLAFGLPACSSSEDSTPGSSGGTSNNTSGTGNISGTTGSGGSSAGTTGTGGSSAGTTGTGGSSAGTSSTGGTGVGGGANPAECQGIQRNMACPVEGTQCPGLKCGLCDSGTRDCSCTGGIWTCSSCDFSASEFMTPPASPVACSSQADEVACAGMAGDVCTGAAGGEVCGCCDPAKFADGEVWDCDDPPSTWPAQ